MNSSYISSSSSSSSVTSDISTHPSHSGSSGDSDSSSDDSLSSNSSSGALEPQRLNILYPSFLPEMGDFELLCYGFYGAGGRRHSISVNKEVLARESVLFRDMLACAPAEGADSLEVQHRSSTMLLALSAALEPNRAFVSTCGKWRSLYHALLVAQRFQMDRARDGLFLAMLVLAGDSTVKLRTPARVTEFFAEAARQGNAALRMASLAFKCRKELTKQALKIEPVELTSHHIMELGAQRCSDFTNAVLCLVADEVLAQS